MNRLERFKQNLLVKYEPFINKINSTKLYRKYISIRWIGRRQQYKMIKVKLKILNFRTLNPTLIEFEFDLPSNVERDLYSYRFWAL